MYKKYFYIKIYLFSILIIFQNLELLGQKHNLNLKLNGSYFFSPYRLAFLKYSASYNIALYENAEYLYEYNYLFNIYVNYTYKNLFYTYINQDAFCSEFNNKTYNFVPNHAYWVVGVGVKYKAMYFEISHMCSHHIFNNKMQITRTYSYIYGSSYNKFTIGFNFNLLK